MALTPTTQLINTSTPKTATGLNRFTPQSTSVLPTSTGSAQPAYPTSGGSVLPSVVSAQPAAQTAPVQSNAAPVAAAPQANTGVVSQAVGGAPAQPTVSVKVTPNAQQAGIVTPNATVDKATTDSLATQYGKLQPTAEDAFGLKAYEPIKAEVASYASMDSEQMKMLTPEEYTGMVSKAVTELGIPNQAINQLVDRINQASDPIDVAGRVTAYLDQANANLEQTYNFVMDAYNKGLNDPGLVDAVNMLRDEQKATLDMVTKKLVGMGLRDSGRMYAGISEVTGQYAKAEGSMVSQFLSDLSNRTYNAMLTVFKSRQDIIDKSTDMGNNLDAENRKNLLTGLQMQLDSVYKFNDQAETLRHNKVAEKQQADQIANEKDRFAYEKEQNNQNSLMLAGQNVDTLISSLVPDDKGAVADTQVKMANDILANPELFAKQTGVNTTTPEGQAIMNRLIDQAYEVVKIKIGAKPTDEQIASAYYGNTKDNSFLPNYFSGSKSNAIGTYTDWSGNSVSTNSFGNMFQNAPWSPGAASGYTGFKAWQDAVNTARTNYQKNRYTPK